VVRGDEESAILVAARRDNTTALEMLHHEVHPDHPYKEKKKNKMARSRMLVCKVSFKQNIGHLGKDIVVCGVHGHYRTMKMEWLLPWKEFWDRLARYVQVFGIQFVAGDFNMSITEVVKQLRSRGILCDCVAWYPWHYEGECCGQNEALAGMLSQQRLGFDSCGIFYIGGKVEVRMTRPFRDIDFLSAVADEHEGLDVYRGTNVPGQPWVCYRSRTHNEKPEDKNLKARLTDLLTPSTTERELNSIPKPNHHCPWLRIKHKKMDYNEWIVEGQIHNGAHFPLAVFTDNVRAMSEERAIARSKGRGKGKGKKGPGSTAVAAPFDGQQAVPGFAWRAQF
jgi:hypothetical protein